MKPPKTDSPRQAARFVQYLAFAAAFLWFGLLWLMDFPKPFVDDLFYCGAGLNLASGGDLSNPFLARHFTTHFFFVYPPVHSYMLAGWLKIFGISALSMTGFQSVMYLAIALAVIAILRKYGAGISLQCLVPLFVTVPLMGAGLRPEPLALALTLSGFAVFVCGPKKLPVRLLSFFLMFTGGATAPRSTMFDAMLVLYALYDLWRDAAGDLRKFAAGFSMAVAALLLTVFMILCMIYFRFGEFWDVFHMHAQANVGGKLTLKDLSLHFGPTQEIFLVVGGILAVLLFKRRSDRLVQIGLTVALAFPIQLVSRALGQGSGSFYALFIIFCLAAAVLKHSPKLIKVAVVSGLVCILVYLNAFTILKLGGALIGKINPALGDQYALGKRQTSTAEHPLILDEGSARYVYDYRVPPGSLALFWTSPFPIFGFASDYRSNDLYVLSPRWVEHVERSTYLEPAPNPQWQVWKWSFDQFPRKVTVVPAELCKGVRSTEVVPDMNH